MKKILFICIFISLLQACKNDSDEPVMNNDFYKSYYTDNILPSVENLNEALKTQETNINNFKVSKSDEDFEKMIKQWLVCAKAFSKAEIYNFGKIKDNFFYLNIYNFPANTNKIEININNQTVYDNAFFSSQSTSAKGIGTLEYLLFANQNSTEAKTLLLNDSYRIDYLLGIVRELVKSSNELINFWKNDYSTTFVDLNGSFCTENPKCLTINQIINVLDIAKVTKIGKPTGFENSGYENVDLLQAYRSKTSLLLIKAMLEEIQYAYFDSATNYATIVNSIDHSKKISEAIQEKLLFTKEESLNRIEEWDR